MYLLEKQRRDWEASQAEMRQEWEKEQERERQKWAVEQENSRRRYEGRFVTRWLPLLLAGIIGVLSTVVAYQGSQLEAEATRDAARMSAPVAVSPQSTPDTSAGQQ